MTALGLALLWAALLATAGGLAAADARRERLRRADPDGRLAPPRRRWGGAPDLPPSHWLLPRVAAAFARIARAADRVEGASRLRPAARAVSLLALATALSLIPFAGRWGGDVQGAALVVLDLDAGVLALAMLLGVGAWAPVVHALGERGDWGRLAATRAAGRASMGLALLVLSLAALVVRVGSLRPADLVQVQAGSVAPLTTLAAVLGDGEGLRLTGGALELLRLPAWHLVTQPLTALLFALALALLLRRPRAGDPRTGTVVLVGTDLDDDPAAAHLGRVESRLAELLGGALFVALFLGAGSLPGVTGPTVVGGLTPFVGNAMASAANAALECTLFTVELAGVSIATTRMRRALAVARDDAWLRATARRLVPVAWANLLLVAAWGQLSASAGGTG